MKDMRIQVFLDDIRDFVKTFVIKDEATALAVNRELINNGIQVDRNDPSTWRYYMNLAGEYHENDEMMTITSLDTLEEINFTKEMLEIHRGTKRGYTLYSQYYTALVNRYPNQTNLIRGVISPVNINDAINAPDYTLLGYDPSYVESNEYSLISHIQDTLYRYVGITGTNFGAVYYDSDKNFLVNDLFGVIRSGVIYSLLKGVIAAYRFEAMRTARVHSFHIKAYLASHGGLDQYYDYLTKKQAIWLYMNLPYIEAHPGHKAAFDEMVEHLLTERSLPLQEYRLVQDTVNMPEQDFPDIKTFVYGMNLGTEGKKLLEYSIPNTLAKEQGFANRNTETQGYYAKLIERDGLLAANGELPTKLMESQVNDITDGVMYTLFDVIMNHWAYYTNMDMYTTTVVVNHPASGEAMRINARTAYLLYIYCWSKAYGVTLDSLPVMRVTNIARPDYVSKDEIYTHIGKGSIPELYVNYFMDTQVRSVRPVSMDAFYEHCQAVQKMLMKNYHIAGSQDDINRFKNITRMNNLATKTGVVNWQSAGVTYHDWLIAHGLDVEGLSNAEADTLAADLLSVTTGYHGVGYQSLADIQKAMIGIISSLTSYSVQIIQSINTGTIRVLPGSSIRTGTINATGHGQTTLDPQYHQRVISDGLSCNEQALPVTMSNRMSRASRGDGYARIDVSSRSRPVIGRSSSHITMVMSGPYLRAIEEQK